ncbi:MAG: aminotransferase class IV [Campylobacterales bacterium]
MLLFESIKVVDGAACNLNYHQKRVENSLGFTPSFDIKNLIKTNSKSLQKAKLIYNSSGEVESLEISAYKKRDIKSFRLVESNLEYDKKYLDREEIDGLFAKKGIADEILITQNSLLKDTSIANIALFIDKKWLTPAKPLLKGTTRERLLQEEKIFESMLIVDDLKLCSKIALLNAMVEFYVVEDFRIL